VNIHYNNSLIKLTPKGKNSSFSEIIKHLRTHFKISEDLKIYLLSDDKKFDQNDSEIISENNYINKEFMMFVIPNYEKDENNNSNKDINFDKNELKETIKQVTGAKELIPDPIEPKRQQLSIKFEF
jgi:hypothetical protein